MLYTSTFENQERTKRTGIAYILAKKRAPHSIVAKELGEDSVEQFAFTSIVLWKKKRNCNNLALAHAYDTPYRIQNDIGFPEDFNPHLLAHDDAEDGGESLEEAFLILAATQDLFGDYRTHTKFMMTDLSSMTMNAIKERYGRPDDYIAVMRALSRIPDSLGKDKSGTPNLARIKENYFTLLEDRTIQYFQELGEGEENPIRVRFLNYFREAKNSKSNYASLDFMRNIITEKANNLSEIVQQMDGDELAQKMTWAEKYAFDDYGLFEELKAQGYGLLYVKPLLAETRTNILKGKPHADLLLVGKDADGLDNLRTMDTQNDYQMHKVIRKTEQRRDQTENMLEGIELKANTKQLINKINKELFVQINDRIRYLGGMRDSRYEGKAGFLLDEWKRLYNKYNPSLTLKANLLLRNSYQDIVGSINQVARSALHLVF